MRWRECYRASKIGSITHKIVSEPLSSARRCQRGAIGRLLPPPVSRQMAGTGGPARNTFGQRAQLCGKTNDVIETACLAVVVLAILATVGVLVVAFVI
jgi:hypothetical protein